MSHSLADALYFVSRFIKKPDAVGSIWPSSRKLGAAMIEGISLKAGDVVVEYGPGTGPFTKLLQPYVAQGIKYLGIERDRKLVRGLQRRFPEMQFHCGSAAEAPQLLKHYGLGAARLIISGLPFANMPRRIQEQILKATQQTLLSDGHFRTFTYLFTGINPQAQHFQQSLQKRFYHDHGSKTVILNFPPARVLRYSHPVR